MSQKVNPGLYTLWCYKKIYIKEALHVQHTNLAVVKYSSHNLMRDFVGKVIVSLMLIALICSALSVPSASAAAIGLKDTGGSLIVTTGAGLVYTIKKSNGDMTSCKLNGTELCGSSKGSHIGSGLGSSANVSYSKSPSGGTVVITVETDTLTHYYVSRRGQNIIYMATYTTAEPSVGELRYIFRGNSAVLTDIPTNADLTGNTGAVESKDVFGFSNGQTASKYYGNDQARDLTIQGATGENVGVFMAYGNRETSSGGPFFRDIQFQRGSDTEIYNYMNSGHNQTEDFRTGLHGPYALVFTDGSTPSVPDFSWMSSLNIKGWVSSRGKVVLNGLKNMDSDYEYTVGFANDTAQYWTKATSKGEAVCSNMKPGTYTMTVYKNEVEVYTEQVEVNANKVTTLNSRTISDDPSSEPVLWRIGEWDGTPIEFLNGQTITERHPSDPRNPSWGPVTYTVGSSSDKFPAIQFRGINSPTKITFNLNSSQAKDSHTLNIGITCAYSSGRPNVTVNGHSLSIPSASSQPKSRSYTIGTYRGNNATFSYDIPASYLINGKNKIEIAPGSGSSDLSSWLSAGFSYDCVELTN